jgi:hypothetical protein
MDAKSGVHDQVRSEVRALLGRAPAYRELPDAERAQLAADMAKVGVFLADKGWLTHHAPAAGAPVDGPPGLDALREKLVREVDFPGFVASLIQGVFHAIVDSSIQQMQAYAELVASVSKEIDELLKDEGSDAAAGDLCRQRQQQLATMLLRGIHRIVVE